MPKLNDPAISYGLSDEAVASQQNWLVNLDPYFGSRTNVTAKALGP